MLQTASPEETEDIVRSTPAGGEIHVREFIGSVRTLHRGPQAFFSGFDPGYVIDPHYHTADQFQIVVGGTATIGTHRFDPITVHYTDAFTAYGPIVCGDQGMSFFNFRGRCDIGTQYMPEARKQMAIRGGRSITAVCALSLQTEVRSLRMEAVIELEDDGLAAYEYVLAPDARLPEDAAAGNGRFQLVLDGTLVASERDLPRHSVACVASGERFTPRRAGAGGAHVLEVQFPKE